MPLIYLIASDQQKSLINDHYQHARAYAPYGGSNHPAGPLLAFCAERRDPLTGCYHLGNGHRPFNPRLLRFVAADRLSPFDQGGINAYAYCAGDPINRSDPSGRAWIQWLNQLVSFGLNAIFTGAAVNRAASAIVMRSVNGAANPTTAARLFNAASFYGGVTGVPSRVIITAATASAPLGSGLSLAGNLTSAGSQVLTGLGAMGPNLEMFNTWSQLAQANGIHRGRVLIEAVAEASAINLLIGREPVRLPVRRADVEMGDIRSGVITHL